MILNETRIYTLKEISALGLFGEMTAEALRKACKDGTFQYRRYRRKFGMTAEDVRVNQARTLVPAKADTDIETAGQTRRRAPVRSIKDVSQSGPRLTPRPQAARRSRNRKAS